MGFLGTGVANGNTVADGSGTDTRMLTDSAGRPIVKDGNTAADGSGTSLMRLVDSTGRPVTNPPIVATPVGADSGNVAAAIATGTLSGAAGKVTYLTGFTISGLGATAGVNVVAALAGLASTINGGALNYNVGVPAGATVPMNFSKEFNTPLAASGSGNITLTVPSFGSGNTNARVTMTGFQV